MHRPEDLLDAHPIVEDAVEHGVGDFVVVQGTGFHARGCDAEGCATVAPGPVFAIGDVETDDLLVGDGTDLTVKDILALTQLATSRAWGLARGAFQGYGANVGILHLYGLPVRRTWLGNHISQHADLNFRCQEQLWNNITLSASARSLDSAGARSCWYGGFKHSGTSGNTGGSAHSGSMSGQALLTPAPQGISPCPARVMRRPARPRSKWRREPAPDVCRRRIGYA